jgi:hypothetical protein
MSALSTGSASKVVEENSSSGMGKAAEFKRNEHVLGYECGTDAGAKPEKQHPT